MQTAAGSKMASPCWVCAKSRTLPPGRTASIAVDKRVDTTANDRIGAAALCGSANARRNIFSSRRGSDGLQAKSGSDGVAFGIEIGGQHRCAGTSCEHSMQDADRSLADHQHRLVRLQIERLDSLEHRVYRLYEGRLLEGNTVRNANHAAIANDPIHRAHILGEASARGLKACGDSGWLVDRALGEGLLAAVEAVAARNVMEDHHPLANRESSQRLRQ
jgi:hypothetical protein